MVTATFLTEDSYLGEITNPLTLNRYNYTLSNYLNYQDPSGHKVTKEQLAELSRYYYTRSGRDKYNTGNPTFWMLYRHLDLLDNIGSKNATVDYVTQYNYRNSYLANVFKDSKYEEWIEYGGEYAIRAVARIELRDYLIENNGNYDKEKLIELFVASKGANMNYEYKGRRASEAELFGSD